MAQGNGLTRGDRNRNRKLAALREVVRRDRAVLAVDLGEDRQAAVVMDHENGVLARKTVQAKAHQLGGLLEWGAAQARKAGFAGVTVACEPTGHRWKALMGLADAAGHGFACVQPLAVHGARESDDYTMGKTDLLTELPDVAAAQEASHPRSRPPGCPKNPVARPCQPFRQPDRYGNRTYGAQPLAQLLLAADLRR